MALYSSNYTGQEIDQKLGEVANKINKTDIVDDKTVGESNTPASSRLVKEAYVAIDAMKDVTDNKVMRIDAGEQVVNGRKKFASIIEANAGMTVPSDATIEILGVPTADTAAINLGLLKEHGIDSSAVNNGISVTKIQAGFLKIGLDFSKLQDFPVGKQPNSYSVMVDGVVYRITDQAFRDFVYQDTRFTTLEASNSDKVSTSTFDTTVTSLTANINSRVLISTYNVDLAATNTALNARVLTTTYNANVTATNAAIALKVDTSTYNTKMTALDAADNARVLITTYTAGLALKVDVSTYNSTIAGINTSLNGKVDTSTYNTKMTAIDSSISAINTALPTKMDYTKSGTGSAVGGATTNLITFPKKEVAMFVVSAVWAGIAKPAVFEVCMTNDGTSSFVDSRVIFAGSLTFTTSLTGGNMVLQAVNGDATKTVTLSYKTLVQY